MAGRPTTDDRVPCFWSDQYDVKLQLFGRPEPTDEVGTRGDPARRSATFFWLRDGRVMAAASMKRPREVRAAGNLIEKRATVDPELLADESVDLRRLPVTTSPTVARWATTALGDRGVRRKGAKDRHQLGRIVSDVAVALPVAGIVDDGDLGALAVDVHPDGDTHQGLLSPSSSIPEAWAVG
jgi:hypothetical protein